MSIIKIGEILVSSEILTEYFACDYPVCKGICCVVGDGGAPLKEEECEEIERLYPLFSPLLSENSFAAVEKEGFFSIDVSGEMVTPLVGGEGECAYAVFEGENCFCGMEKIYRDGVSRFKKPASCWLYPIRVSHLRSGLIALNLHRWHICQDAFIKGKREKILVFEFLREPLIAHFGEEFYRMLEVAANTPEALS